MFGQIGFEILEKRVLTQIGDKRKHQADQERVLLCVITLKNSSSPAANLF